MSSVDVKRTTPVSHLGHVLLISPRTFSYHLKISKCLRSMGYSVTWWDDRACSALWFKVALRMFPTFTARLSSRVYIKRLSELDANSISHVLVIKGEGLSQSVIRKIRDVCASASVGLYLWDSVDNVRSALSILSEFDSVATFDPVDAEKFGMVYRPLFWFGNAVANSKNEELLFDWCFIGTIHSDRHRVIHSLRKSGGTKIRSYVFAYFQSTAIMLARHCFDWTLWMAPKGTLSVRAMSTEEVVQKITSTKAVLDVEHPGQRGLTMRTIETLMAGKKLITTNKNILFSNLYHPTRVAVISRHRPEIPSAFLEEPFLVVSDSLRAYYSCEGWVSELLANQDAAKLKGRSTLGSGSGHARVKTQ